MQLIDKNLLDTICQQVIENPRLRINYNFHDSLDAPSQRLLNAIQPESVLPVHRHRNTAETYIILRGRLRVMFYNDQKELTETAILDPKEGVFGINIPAGEWHTVEILALDTVIFETKDGPYLPHKEEDILKH
jgi:cupin fold WbuC family metalloprotein